MRRFLAGCTYMRVVGAGTSRIQTVCLITDCGSSRERGSTPMRSHGYQNGGICRTHGRGTCARNPPADANPAMLREIACCDLAGSGVEFGAGTKRAAIPLRCSVRYADHQSAETLQARKYPGQDGDFVQLDLHSNLQTMEGYRRRQS